MCSNLDERLVHVLNDLSGNVGLELEVVVDLDGHVHVGRLQVLPHHLHGAAAGLVGDLPALPVGRRDRRAARQ